jgi:hypothetical protein
VATRLAVEAADTLASAQAAESGGAVLKGPLKFEGHAWNSCTTVMIRWEGRVGRPGCGPRLYTRRLLSQPQLR